MDSDQLSNWPSSRFLEKGYSTHPYPSWLGTSHSKYVQIILVARTGRSLHSTWASRLVIHKAWQTHSDQHDHEHLRGDQWELVNLWGWFRGASYRVTRTAGPSSPYYIYIYIIYEKYIFIYKTIYILYDIDNIYIYMICKYIYIYVI